MFYFCKKGKRKVQGLPQSVYKMHAEGVLCKFCHVYNFKTFIDVLYS